MRIPKLAILLVFITSLLSYLMFMKRHYSNDSNGSLRQPPYAQPPGAALSPSPSPSAGHPQYGIMIDAGSTGTRVHVFHFLVQPDGAPKLAHETFRGIKPGLSAYADEPEQCKAGLLELLEVAKVSVPSWLWRDTPLVLRATAGLRLLPGQKASVLLEQVRALFSESPFLSREDSVSIMDGADEGISAWITVNFLTGGFHGSDTPTVGMLDLGGGSTQITFSPQDEKTIQMSPVDHISSVKMFSTTHTLYSHSYLGLGLMSARLAVLGGLERQPLEGSVELVSPCLAPEYSGHWKHAEVVYSVKGQKEGEPAYEACLTKVQKVLFKKVLKAAETNVDFYAFSYYYDRAVDVGLIDEKTGGWVRVGQYSEAAKRACSRLSVRPASEPFLCLDLTYISILLSELGFPADKRLRLARTIDQVETSWALGATFHYLDTLRRQ